MRKVDSLSNNLIIFTIKVVVFFFALLSLNVLFLNNAYLVSWEILTMNFMELSLDLVLDKESVLFFISLGAITSGVFTYSESYMAGDKHFDRFFFILFFFVVSMVLLIFGGNMFMLMIGWDGLGVTSFLLVIYFQNKNSMNAGLITIFTNRIGDVLIMSSMALMMSHGFWGWWTSGIFKPFLASSIVLLLLVAAFTKSAQVPFSSWLPAAMAAPTPVSSLVHSSTLVTAGIYLLLRFKEYLFMNFCYTSEVLLFVGAITMVMAGMSGMYEDDLKKMVALSTLSQLGLMVCSLGLMCSQLAFFHLLSHAYFKALLFMATGSMIHSVGNYQDLRVLRLPSHHSVKTSSILMVSNLSLMGFPFLSGFYSKDMILEFSLSSNFHFFLGAMFTWGTLLTVLYSFRFIIKSSSGGVSREPLFQHSDKDWLMFKGFDYLFLLAILGGSTLNYCFLGWAPTLFLTMEVKNFILALILSGALLFSSGLMKTPLSLKTSLSTMINLSPLAKSFLKSGTFIFVGNLDKMVEKNFLKFVLFEGPFYRMILSLVNARSLVLFWSVSGLFAAMFFFLCFSNEMFMPSFGLGLGYYPKVSLMSLM